jgi:hypothetical protein
MLLTFAPGEMLIANLVSIVPLK